MKKPFLLIPIGFATLAGLAALGHSYNNQNLASCNAGEWSACQKLFDAEHMHDQVTNPDFNLAVAKQRREKAAAEREANKWQPTAHNKTMLAFACGQKNIKTFLKDPNSFRELSTGMSELTDTHVTVFVNYTATNGFGGRVQDTKTCRYTR